MDEDELLRNALRRLLRADHTSPAGTPQRRAFVAEQAGISPDNLYQAATARRLPSGRVRSIGKDLRSALDQAFPDWRMYPSLEG